MMYGVTVMHRTNKLHHCCYVTCNALVSAINRNSFVCVTTRSEHVKTHKTNPTCGVNNYSIYGHTHKA